jgi:ubiquinone/menaquinone biosynthesis C-methylase UbiE
MQDIIRSATLFRYKCDCGNTDRLLLEATAARCRACGATHSVSDTGIIDFFRCKTEQNDYFDRLYDGGLLHKIDDRGADAIRTYQNSALLAQNYLSLCGLDPSSGLEDLSILDVACGSGWVTAGILMHPSVRHCRFHAFDISGSGLNLLAGFLRTLNTSNRVEMSIQNAGSMIFEDGTFDFVVGSSVLHHFDDVQSFLTECRRVLTDRGVATFGEPFAVGYGLGSAALLLAQRRLCTSYTAITELYNDISIRVRGPSEIVQRLVDKHLFMHSTFLAMARRAGFKEVEFIPLASRDFYREHFIDELLVERGICDPLLSQTANEIYRAVFDIFDEPSYGHSVAAFIQIVLRA